MAARDVGCEREPVTGERAGRDFGKGSPFAYQHKLRKSISKSWIDWLRGIRKTAEQHGQIGVLVLNRPHSPRRDALVVLAWQDWVDLHGDDVRSEPG